ncbi:protein vav isoform X2 [Bombus vosnesenskii]|uniref:Protein vav isoform X2 n=3 Tax=Pyrobombus TaxID=144703 RepID=A0A6J3K6S4_9HYME|nr:protein vav isoform X2 [Bombus impatiens]XP_033184240.1 protein vav isoform X2 [Bombus vancouverensis nearcticus]XP_033300577.1 protein vav isoform X2 [Bombus bifarius]XP_033348166.1 protein vav isoform X2 [Bombus vosnesenskii]XP_050472028.1 protein vav isoform X2 [Bombus huntii]
MSRIESGPDNGSGWHECVKWLTRCGALRADHKANWPEATAVDLAYTLRDGVLLCNLLNTVDPGCIDMKDVNQKPQMAQFLCLRNIKVFLSACSTTFGLSDSELFEPSMLFDLSDFLRVLRTLSALSNCPRLRRKGIPGFSIGHGRSQEDIYKDLQSAGAGPTTGVGTFTMKPKSMDVDESQVYQELLCFSSNSQHDWPSTEKDGAISGGEKRDYVIQELVETERNYSDVLNSLLKHFARPLSSLLRPEDCARIFFGIKELAEIHAGFHSQLRKARTGAALAQVFLDWREKFLIYGDYCANLTLAQNTLQEACARYELVNQEVIRCQQEANNGKFKLRDILSVPMQRVLKYHLLLDKLVEETPCDWLEDRRQLGKAREVMVDIAQYINEVKRDSDTLDIIRDIQASIIDWDVPEDAQLKDFGRLLRDGELKVKAHGDQRVKARYAFIFEQVVLICKAGRGEQYCYRETLRLDDYRLEDHTGRRTLGRDSRWSYQWLLVHKQEYTAYTLYARTEEQKQMWIKALQDAMDNVNPAACRNTNHKFKLTTFDTPRSCQRCGKFLKGRIFQGYRCEVCRYAVHKQCIAHSGRCMPVPPPPPPPPPLPCERALSVKLWFVGEMGRDTASNKLEPREDGTYMLRVRPAGQPRLKHETNYALSIKADGAVKHIRVFKRDVDGADVYYLSESRFFKSVVELVEYYERASLSENFEKLDQRLLWPYRRVLAKALFDFRGGERNQLSLRRGCRVVVLSKEGDAKGWWKGKIGDQVGFFPKEYVEEE